MLQPMELLFKLKLIYQKLVKTISPNATVGENKSWILRVGIRKKAGREGLWMRGGEESGEERGKS